jgi:hypothetical protein
MVPATFHGDRSRPGDAQPMIRSMSRGELDALLLILGGSVVVAAAIAVAAVRPRRQLVAPYVITLALSFAAYLLPPTINGRDDFHRRLEIALVAALIVGALAAARAFRARDALGRLAVCLLGVATPPLVLFGLLTAACWDKTDCLG